MRARNIARTVFAILFILGAVANGAMGLLARSVYEGFADLAILPLYRDLWAKVVYPNIGVLLVALILAELLMAWLLLGSGAPVKVGLILALAFTLGLVPFWWQGGAVANILLALVLVWLLRGDYPRSIPEIVRGG
jgi:hypothetical protein